MSARSLLRSILLSLLARGRGGRRIVVQLAHRDGVTLDVALGAFSFEEHSIERTTWWQQAPDVRLLTCGSEDLIVHKAFASRDLDWMDVERVIMRQGRKLDAQLRSRLCVDRPDQLSQP